MSPPRPALSNGSLKLRAFPHPHFCYNFDHRVIECQRQIKSLGESMSQPCTLQDAKTEAQRKEVTQGHTASKVTTQGLTSIWDERWQCLTSGTKQMTWDFRRQRNHGLPGCRRQVGLQQQGVCWRRFQVGENHRWQCRESVQFQRLACSAFCLDCNTLILYEA